MTANQKALEALREAIREALSAAESCGHPLGGAAAVNRAWEAKKEVWDAIALLEAEQAQAAQAVPAEPAAWREHVEERIRSWRHARMNADGDQLSIDDYMDAETQDDLIEFVCCAPPSAGRGHGPMGGAVDDELPPVPKAANKRRQQRKNGGYCMVDAYTADDMKAYARMCAAAQAVAVPRAK